MRAGDLDIQVTVERKFVTQDPVYGSEIITWVPLVSQPGSPSVAQRFWAQLQQVLPSRGGSESLQPGIVMAKNPARLRLRYRSDIDSSMRITAHLNPDILYQIIGGPVMIGRREWIELMLEEHSS